MACSLLSEWGMLWLAVGAADEQGEGMERLLAQLASIMRFASDLDGRLAADGLGGLASVRDLHRRVEDVLTALTPGVALARGGVAELIAALHAMEATLAALRRLKIELGHAS